MRLLIASVLITGTAFGGMTVDGARWSTNSVEVCFATKKQGGASRFAEDSKTFPTHPAKVKLENWTDAERAAVETIIRNEYRLAATSFEFTGFQECTPGTSAKIFVYVGRGGPLGAGNIGENMKIDKFWMYRDREGREIISPVYVKLATALPSYLYFQNTKALGAQPTRLSPDERFQLTALHEFGHASGLLHEDERAEANQNPNCAYVHGQSNFRVSKPIPLSAYDGASIMSYCFLDFLNEKAGLHYQVARPGFDPEKLPSNGLPILRWPGLFLEDSSRTVAKTEIADRYEFTLRLGLSDKDRQSIRCLYAPTSTCHPL